mmetsp:Transcript_28422/g.48034  ORF Transcript_28422/g.48034 Transcript_28422/m.48034 type:complete len:201 (+) Transcript_28422:3688-4290(+)
MAVCPGDGLGDVVAGHRVHNHGAHQPAHQLEGRGAVEVCVVPMQPRRVVVGELVGVHQLLPRLRLHEHRVHVRVHVKPVSVYVGGVGAVHGVMDVRGIDRVVAQFVNQCQSEVVTRLEANGGARVAAHVVQAVAARGEGHLRVGMSVLAHLQRHAPRLLSRGGLWQCHELVGDLARQVNCRQHGGRGGRHRGGGRSGGRS